MTQEALKLALESMKRIDAWLIQRGYTGLMPQEKEAIAVIEKALAQEQEPVAHLWECIGRWSAYLVSNGKQANCAPPSWLVDAVNNATTPPQRPRVVFPTMLRKMWSGSEVQAWLDENVDKENT